MREIDYQDVIDLGFKHNGFKYFRVEMKLAKRIKAEWATETRTARIIRCGRHGDILGKIEIENLEQLTQMVHFFKGEK